MLAWLPVALGLWWMVGGDQDQPRVLWAEGTIEQDALWGEPAPVSTGERLVQPRVVLADGARLVLLDDTHTAIGLDGPGAWLIIGGVLRPAEANLSPMQRWDATFFQPPPEAWRAGLISQELPPDASGRAHLEATPRHTSVVQASPVLRWPASAPTTGHGLLLETRDAQGKMHLLEQWRGLRGGLHAPQTVLIPGQWYRWTVSRSGWIDRRGITGAVDPLRSYWFRVLTARAHTLVREQLAKCDALVDGKEPPAGPGQPDTGSGTPSMGPAGAVLRAELLETHGLFQAAENAWRALAKAHPDNPGVARRLQRMERRILTPAQPRWVSPFSQLSRHLGL